MAAPPRNDGLYLDAEQASALRAWWKRWNRESAEIYPPASTLYNAIAPLMKPWRYERYELGWMLSGPAGQYFVQPDRHVIGDYNEQAMSILCGLLNKAEP